VGGENLRELDEAGFISHGEQGTANGLESCHVS
jgi:hypothetical protein